MANWTVGQLLGLCTCSLLLLLHLAAGQTTDVCAYYENQTIYSYQPYTQLQVSLLHMAVTVVVMVVMMMVMGGVEMMHPDRGNDWKTTSKSGLALNGISYYGRLKTVRSGGSWL